MEAGPALPRAPSSLLLSGLGEKGSQIPHEGKRQEYDIIHIGVIKRKMWDAIPMFASGMGDFRIPIGGKAYWTTLPLTLILFIRVKPESDRG